jgi:hypothetical protein
MNIVEELNLFLALLHKGFSVIAFYGRLLSGGYRVEAIRLRCFVKFSGSS